MKKRILASILVVAMFAFCVGCSSSTEEPAGEAAETETAETEEAAEAETEEAASDEPIKLGITGQTLSIACYVWMEETVKELGPENGIEVEWLSCEYDPTKQTSQVEDFISKGYDVIGIEPVMPEMGDALIKLCKDAGIPVFTFETMAATEIPDIHLVADSVKVGEMQAEYFMEQFGTEEEANVVILSATKGDHIAELITEGVLNVLEKQDNVNIIMHQWCQNWDPAVAMSHMENAISSNQGNIQGVFANNDQMANAALKAAINAGIEENLIVVGGDFDEETAVNIKDGYKIASVDKGQFRLQGENMIEVTLQLAAGEEVASDGMDGDVPCLFSPIEVVDAENIDEWIEYKYPHLAE